MQGFHNKPAAGRRIKRTRPPILSESEIGKQKYMKMNESYGLIIKRNIENVHLACRFTAMAIPED